MPGGHNVAVGWALLAGSEFLRTPFGRSSEKSPSTRWDE
jgi:hypothetical protein